MIIVGRLVLSDYKMRHVLSRKPLDVWEKKIRRSRYQGFLDLRKTFYKADFVYHRYTIFDIAGNKYRLITIIDYSKNILLAKKVWTHAEYDKKKIEIYCGSGNYESIKRHHKALDGARKLCFCSA